MVLARQLYELNLLNILLVHHIILTPWQLLYHYAFIFYLNLDI